MASKLAVYETGYEDERFEQIVSQSFHCIICTNVIKDAVICPQNEHLFCRACINIHLMNSQTCPTCKEPLTVETLSQASRGVRNLLAELMIRCDFFDRGCRKLIELGDLERHVSDCGFAPAVCSNEGCQLEVNKRDLLHHETSVCELRRIQCHSCNEIKQEMDRVKVNLAAINEKLLRIETYGKTAEQVQEQLNKQEESNRRLEADNAEMKISLNEITKQLERMTKQTFHEVQADKMKKGIAQNYFFRESVPKTKIDSIEDEDFSPFTYLPEKSYTLLEKALPLPKNDDWDNDCDNDLVAPFTSTDRDIRPIVRDKFPIVRSSQEKMLDHEELVPTQNVLDSSDEKQVFEALDPVSACRGASFMAERSPQGISQELLSRNVFRNQSKRK